LLTANQKLVKRRMRETVMKPELVGNQEEGSKCYHHEGGVGNLSFNEKRNDMFEPQRKGTFRKKEKIVSAMAKKKRRGRATP